MRRNRPQGKGKRGGRRGNADSRLRFNRLPPHRSLGCLVVVFGVLAAVIAVAVAESGVAIVVAVAVISVGVGDATGGGGDIFCRSKGLGSGDPIRGCVQLGGITMRQTMCIVLGEKCFLLCTIHSKHKPFF